MNEYKLIFFGWLSEQTGCRETNWKSDAGNCRDLLNELIAHYKLDDEKTRHFNVAINDDYASMDSAIHSGDLVVFIPPVAGG